MIYGDEEFDLSQVIERNASRRKQKFQHAQRDGAQWLVECRDMGDAFDSDAGIYFVPCASIEEVDGHVAVKTPDNPYDRVMGIYFVRLPLDRQEPGLSRAQWISGREQLNGASEITLELLAELATPAPVDQTVSTQHPLIILNMVIIVIGILVLCFTTFC